MTSADIVRELQAATPVAPQALRLRVRALEAPATTSSSSRLRGAFRGRRWVMLVVPTAAAAAVVAGAITGVFDNPRSTRDAASPRGEAAKQPPQVTSGTAGDTSGGDAQGRSPAVRDDRARARRRARSHRRPGGSSATPPSSRSRSPTATRSRRRRRTRSPQSATSAATSSPPRSQTASTGAPR